MEFPSGPLAHRWPTFIVRGAVSVAAGIAAFIVSPNAAKTLLETYLVVDGLAAIYLGLHLQLRMRSRAVLAADGVSDLAAALLLWVWSPKFVLVTLVVALWAVASGMLEILAAVFMPRFPLLAWGIAFVGLVSFGAGIALMDWTNLAEIGLLYVFAVYALTAGALFLALGVVLMRAFQRRSAN